MSRSKKRKSAQMDTDGEGGMRSKRRQATLDDNQLDEDVSASEQEQSGSEGTELDDEDNTMEWSGFDGDNTQPSELPSPSKKYKKNAIPTGEELRAIKEGEELFKSNTFKLQIESLLSSVRVKDTNSSLPPLERFLHTLHAHLMNSKSVSARQPLQASRELLKHGISIPYALPLPTEDSNWTVAYEKPGNVLVAGSWATKSGVKSRDNDIRWTVDLALEMPAELFQEKDYLDGRFFHKKAFYLASVAKSIKSSKLNVDMVYDCTHGDTRLTTLLLRLRKGTDATLDFSKLKAQIRILPILPNASPINVNHLSPHHANLRLKSSNSSSNENGSASTSQSTPIYNTTLLLHTTAREHLLRTHALVQDVSSFRDGLALLRVWANQRGYCSGKAKPGQGFILGFEDCGQLWVSLLGMLINGEEPFGDGQKKGPRKVVGRGLSSYQLFKAALSYLAQHDFLNNAVFEKTNNGHRFPPKDYTSHHEAILVDSSSSVNLLARIPVSSLNMLRLDAEISLNMFESNAPDSVQFEQAFMTDQSDTWSRFDVVLSVDFSSVKPRHADSVLSILDVGSPESCHLQQLCSLLRRTLGNRVKAFALIASPETSRPLSQAHASRPLSSLHIGLVLDTLNAFRLVEHGPPASEAPTPVTLAFRALWGPKAELRRFKDGRITESVVWDVRNSDERTHIPARIVMHVLSHHFGVKESSVRECYSQFDAVLRLPESISGILQAAGAPVGFKAALAAFDGLIKDIKSLDEELPLALLNVSPIDPHLRYTSIFAPTPLPPRLISSIPSSARYLPSFEVILQFERSAQWPDDLVAIQATKLAFFERIASSLMAKIPGLRADVIIGDGHLKSDIVDQAYLQIVTSDGWAFSARIWHDREATLLQEQAREKSRFMRKLPGYKSDEENALQRKRAVEALDVYTRRFIHSPRHHRAIASLCHHFPAYPGTVRLVKRWMSAHWLLGSHISEEAVELICAAIFLNGARSAIVGEDHDRPGTPGTKEVGFTRVIAFLKEWKWEEGELFVPVYEDDGSVEGEVAPGKVRAGSVTGVWTLATKEDPAGHMWSSHGPNALVARRVRALASATLDAIHGSLFAEGAVRSLFIHPLNHYDMLIHIEPSAISRHHQSISVNSTLLNPFASRKYANIPNGASEERNTAWPGFDPVAMFYNDLKRVYAGTLELFYDIHGGSTIGALWEPSLASERPFRVLAGFSSEPVPVQTTPPGTKSKTKASDQVTLNRAAVLAEIERLGEGIVEKIVVQKQ